jgi:hypothetical protein
MPRPRENTCVATSGSSRHACQLLVTTHYR